MRDLRGYIYFVQIAPDGPIKIGFTATTNPMSRLFALQSSLPWRLKCFGLLPAMDKEEKQIHQRFKKFRMRGEWFEPHKELISAIKVMLKDKFWLELLPERTESSWKPVTLLEQFRKNAGLSQKIIAQKIGVSAGTYGKWEKGETVPSRKLHTKIEGITGISAARFHEAAE